MSGMIAGIGFKAVAGRLAGGLASGARGLFAWFGRRSPLEWLAMVLAVVVVFQHFQLSHARADRDDAVAGRKAAIQALSGSLANERLLRGQLADQSVRVNALAKQSAEQQKAYAEARQKAAGRVASAEAASQRLAASSRQQPPPAAACEPSETLKEQWK